MSVSDQKNPPPALFLRFLSKKVISKLEKINPQNCIFEARPRYL